MADTPEDWMTAADYRPPTDLRPDIPHPARVYDWLLGGKDNFAADREAGQKILELGVEARAAARANRAALQRGVRMLARAGIDQFLDIGTGIPSAGNTHQVVQEVDPAARVVYVDNDPIVLAHARALMSGAGHGATAVLQADLREPKRILASDEVRRLLDLDRPVALLLAAVLHFVPDSAEPYDVVATLMDALPRGSHLLLTHATNGVKDKDAEDGVTKAYSAASAGLHIRSPQEIARFFTGLDLLEPGLVWAPLWRPDTPPPVGSDQLGILAGVAVKR